MRGTLLRTWEGIAKGSVLETDYRKARAEQLVWTDPIRFEQLAREGILVREGEKPRPVADPLLADEAALTEEIRRELGADEPEGEAR